jgi:hypothetical protein
LIPPLLQFAINGTQYYLPLISLPVFPNSHESILPPPAPLKSARSLHPIASPQDFVPHLIFTFSSGKERTLLETLSGYFPS